MDIGSQLVARIIDEGRIQDIQRSGITPDFLDDDSGAILAYVHRHYATYKTVPTRDTIQKTYPNFHLPEAAEPLEYYIDQIKEIHRRNVLDENLRNVAKIYNKDTKAAETILRETISALSVTSKTFRDIDFAASALERIEAYTERKENPGADGILSRWSSFDYQTLGFHKEEFGVLVGEKWMGKSWLMLWLAKQAAKQGENVLITTKEMSQVAMSRRLDSITAGVCFDNLRRGELGIDEEVKYIHAMEVLAKSNERITIARQGVDTVMDIEMKAVETDATIIFADSVYLWDPRPGFRFSGEPSRRMEVSRECKRIATSLGVPVIVSVQAGRKKGAQGGPPTLDDIEWSNAFSQDADTCFFVQKDDIDRELNRAQIWLLKSRDGDRDNFFINQDFQNMDFSERKDSDLPKTDVFMEDEASIFDE